MKIQAVALLVALLLFTSLVTESDCWTGNLPAGKRGLQGKVRKALLLTPCIVYLARLSGLTNNR